MVEQQTIVSYEGTSCWDQSLGTSGLMQTANVLPPRSRRLWNSSAFGTALLSMRPGGLKRGGIARRRSHAAGNTWKAECSRS